MFLAFFPFLLQTHYQIVHSYKITRAILDCLFRSFSPYYVEITRQFYHRLTSIVLEKTYYINTIL